MTALASQISTIEKHLGITPPVLAQPMFPISSGPAVPTSELTSSLIPTHSPIFNSAPTSPTLNDALMAEVQHMQQCFSNNFDATMDKLANISKHLPLLLMESHDSSSGSNNALIIMIIAPVAIYLSLCEHRSIK